MARKTKAPEKSLPSRKSFCPHCRNNSRHQVVYEQTYKEVAEDFESDAKRFAAVCSTCDDLLVYEFVFEVDFSDSETSFFEQARLRWPDAGSLHRSVPTTIQKCYREAFRIRDMAPTSFAVQIGRALEFLCEDRNTGGRTLQDKLDSLVKRGEIPGDLGKMTAAIRILRNLGAHASKTDLSVQDAEALDGFFKSVVEYVYVAPAKLREYQNRLNEMGKHGPATRTMQPVSNPRKQT